ncbi:MAG: PAS domain-containing protein, partial [Ancalomicrobiaceae bacterium]|nr:PAS domain-containing protein [Ancalomicrobiaceae bacterium]
TSIDSHMIASLIGQRGLAGFWRWDLRTDAAEWSIGMYRVLGLDPSEPASFARMQSLMHPADRIDQSDPIGNAKSGVYDYHLSRVIWPNGELRWISTRATIIHGADGEPETLLGTIVDETRHGARLRLAQTAEAELAALEQLPAFVVWRADSRGQMTDVSDWATLTGLASRHALGEGWLSSVPLSERSAVSAKWTAAIASGTTFEMMHHHVAHADGSHKAISVFGLPLRDDRGDILSWIGIFAKLAQSDEIPSTGASPAYPTAPLTGAHIRAARNFLGWTAVALAANADVSLSTLRRIEDAPGVPQVRQNLMAAVRTALDHGGISFWTMPDGSVGMSRCAAPGDPAALD